MTREQSAIIKGFAILFMLIYHLDNIVGIQGLDNVFAVDLLTASHPINYFLIVSGYGLYCAFKNIRLSWSYLFKRTLKLYIAFWLVLLIFILGLGPILYPNHYPNNLNFIILNALGWRWDYCRFTWFLLPYIFMSFSAKFVFQIIDRWGNVVSLLCSMFLYIVASFLISRYFDLWLSTHYLVYHIVLWAQTLFGLTIGAVLARITIAGKKVTWSKLLGKNALIVLLIVISFILRGMVHSSVLNPFHASLVVWLVLHLRFSGVFQQVFVELGKKSMVMWFAQGFIDDLVFPEGIILLRWPVLIYVIWTIVCYLFACLLIPVVNRIAKSLKLT